MLEFSNRSIKICQNQHADESKGPETRFQATFYFELSDKNFPFIILHKLAEFFYKIVFTANVIR